jgi:Kae1-associated kinase Bud32
MTNLQLIQQGAEAKILLNEKENFIIKDRISKSYRIPELDNKIRKGRTKAETKLLIKASEIISAPKPLSTSNIYQIPIPFIKGQKLSEYLNEFPLEKQKQIMKKIGESVAKLHKADIIHGDLTTSNMILVEDKDKYVINCNSKGNLNKVDNDDNISDNKPSDNKDNKTSSKQKEVINNSPLGRVSNSAICSSKGKFKKYEQGCELGGNDFSVFFIDFGLGYISQKTEDKAVDVHLLKQALEAKHFKNWKILFEEFQKSYSKNYPESKQIFERITAVERRGRYRH